MRRTWLTVAVLLLLLGASQGAVGAPSSAAAPLERASSEAGRQIAHEDAASSDGVVHLARQHGDTSARGDQHDAQGDDAAPTPDELVAELQALLSHNATLSTRLVRATLTMDPGFVDIAESALFRNVEDIEMALRPALGADDARQISEQWERQTQSLFQYTTAQRDDDADARRRARQLVDRVADDQASLLAQLGRGRVDRAAAADSLHSFFDHQLEQVDAFAEGAYERSYDAQRMAFAESFPLGRTTATAAMPVPKTSPTDELHTALAMLFGEHVELAIDTMRTGATGATDFEAAASALDANTRDVAEAMDALFGARSAREFNRVWADHIDLFVDYTVAVVEDDTATKDAVRDEFDEVMRRFGETLATVSGDRVDADAVTAAMGEHEQQLIDQIERFAAEDFGQAHDVSYTAYQHIRHVAEVLAPPFAAAVFKDMPRGGPQTGGGGSARR